MKKTIVAACLFVAFSTACKREKMTICEGSIYSTRTGQPLPNFSLGIYSAHAPSYTTSWDSTDAEGRYRLEIEARRSNFCSIIFPYGMSGDCLCEEFWYLPFIQKEIDCWENNQLDITLDPRDAFLRVNVISKTVAGDWISGWVTGPTSRRNVGGEYFTSPQKMSIGDTTTAFFRIAGDEQTELVLGTRGENKLKFEDVFTTFYCKIGDTTSVWVEY